MDRYKSYGRRKAGTWSRPRKGNTTAAARAVRALHKIEAAKAKKDEEITDEGTK